MADLKVTYLGRNGHEVHCELCGHKERYDSADVALADYLRHDCLAGFAR